MQVRCPNCSTAYEIPPPARPRRLRCAECATEWRESPPDTVAAVAPTDPVQAPVLVADNAIAADAVPDAAAIDPRVLPGPAIADALRPGPTERRTANGLVFWLVCWVLSLLLIAGAVVASWHFRAVIEHRWPDSLWLFRLLPAGVPA